MLNEFFAHVESGEVKRIGIRRGGRFNGKQLGKNSSDTAYAELGLYPIAGSKPDYDPATETCTGPTYEWVEESQTVQKTYTVQARSIEDLRAVATEQINQIRARRQSGTIPATLRGTEYKFQADDAELDRIGLWALAWQSGQLDNPPQYYRTRDNVNAPAGWESAPLTADEFKQLANDLADWRAALTVRSHQIKDTEIPKAASAAEIQAIVSAYETFDPAGV